MNKQPLKEELLKVKELKKIYYNIKMLSSPPRGNKPARIIAITKTYSYKAIEEAYKNGIRDIGENKIQELETKTKNKKIPKELKIHMVGHLQTNKAKKAVKMCDYIQSIDSLKIAKAVNTEARKTETRQKIYLQINIGKDKKKHGFRPNKIHEACYQISQMSHLKVCGIMTILPQACTPTRARSLFNKMTDISKSILSKTNKDCREISMGMSNDYNIALECGATNIRIGTKLFGKRK